MNQNCHRQFGLVAFVALTAAWIGGGASASHGSDKEIDLAAGKELFTREWLHGDSRSFAGDGLGPVFNARSCLACHHQGGVGGAGTKETNVTLISVFVTTPQVRMLTGLALHSDDLDPSAMKQPDRDKLAELHPALRSQSSFPLHRFGAHEDHDKWKMSLFSDDISEDGVGRHVRMAINQSVAFNIREEEITKEMDRVMLALIPSQRNTPPLFGAGLIDRIPDFVLEQIAAEQEKAARAQTSKQEAPKDGDVGADGSRGQVFEDGPLPVKGRVSRLKDGRVGRFGWKANVATLKEFTLQASSGELGLEVPGFPRAAPAWKPGYKAPGLDLSTAQCDQLIRFVAAIPRPRQRPAETPKHAEEIAAGLQLFATVGCAVCHRPKLGDVDGIYSDLLLHDMGQMISDSGSYRTEVTMPEVAATENPLPVRLRLTGRDPKERPAKFSATTREWRTPPLWGLRDSAPYLHDGRADTIADAVALHGGEGMLAAEAFFKLAHRERQQVELFLQSLAAPETRK